MAAPPRFLRPLLARVHRGIFRRPLRDAPRPAELLELYGAEGCRACRRVRRVLTELDLDYIHRSCPIGESPNRAALEARGGKAQVPYLVDPNTGVEMYESRAITAYLSRTYGEMASRSDSRARDPGSVTQIIGPSIVVVVVVVVIATAMAV